MSVAALQQSLRLDGFNSINDRGVAALAKALHSNISLRLLDLSGQNIYPAGARALASMLGVNRSLETLKLHQNALEDEGVVALVDALREHADTVALTALDVGHNQWGGDEAVRAVCAMLGATRTLRSLEVEQSGLGDSGTATLAATLRTQRTLRHLNLRRDRVFLHRSGPLLSAFTHVLLGAKSGLFFHSFPPGCRGSEKKSLASA